MPKLYSSPKLPLEINEQCLVINEHSTQTREQNYLFKYAQSNYHNIILKLYDFIPESLSEIDHLWIQICRNFQMTFVSSFLEEDY